MDGKLIKKPTLMLKLEAVNCAINKFIINSSICPFVTYKNIRPWKNPFPFKELLRSVAYLQFIAMLCMNLKKQKKQTYS